MPIPHKTAIVILTYNNLAYNKDCINSIRTYTAPDAYELIVVDNGSSDGTREWLKEQSGIKLLLNEENAGFPKGCNMGIALAEKDSDILLLNNDTIVTANWLENLQCCLYSAEDVGAAGAVCNHNENLQWEDLPYGGDFEKMQALAKENNRPDSARWEQKLFLIGFCILIKRTVFDAVGPLDEAYSPGYVEDNDYSLRILTAGYRLMLCHDCFIHHYLGSQFRKDLNRFYPVLYKNRAIFEAKWGFSAFAFDEIRFASLRLMKEPSVQAPLRVLELGCNIGATLLKLKWEHPDAELYGVEPNGAKARIAACVATVVHAPVDAFSLAVEPGYFDCILIGDLLGSVAQPEAFLKNLRAYLKPGGVLIGELQNPMHVRAVKALLKGEWRYGPQDVRNSANRNEYARDDISTLAAKCGYKEPYVFHWYSTLTEEEKELSRQLGALCGEQRTYLYGTYLFTFRFEKQADG